MLTPLREQLRGVFNRDGYARLPGKASLQPHPQFLHFHREKYRG